MKVVITCLALVLSLSPLTRADIHQVQDTVLGLGSSILLEQGQQAAETLQNLAVNNVQQAGSSGTQSLVGNLTQTGSANSGGAAIGVQQGLTAEGLQTVDLAGFNWPQVQGPNIGDVLSQISLGAGLPALSGSTLLAGQNSSLSVADLIASRQSIITPPVVTLP